MIHRIECVGNVVLRLRVTNNTLPSYNLNNTELPHRYTCDQKTIFILVYLFIQLNNNYIVQKIFSLSKCTIF